MMITVPTLSFWHRHLLKIFLLGIFTLCFSFAIDLVSAFTSGKLVREAALATTVVVIGLTMYTFWAAKRGQDFGFLAPLLLSILLLLFMFSVFQVLNPVGRMSDVIYSGLSMMLFCGSIVFETQSPDREAVL